MESNYDLKAAEGIFRISECSLTKFLAAAYAPFFGYIGAASAQIFTVFGAAYGTAKSAVGICSMVSYAFKTYLPSNLYKETNIFKNSKLNDCCIVDRKIRVDQELLNTTVKFTSFNIVPIELPFLTIIKIAKEGRFLRS